MPTTVAKRTYQKKLLMLFICILGIAMYTFMLLSVLFLVESFSFKNWTAVCLSIIYIYLLKHVHNRMLN